MKDHLSKMAYWAKLFGVLGFILIAIMVIAAIGMFFFGSDLDMYGYEFHLFNTWIILLFPIKIYLWVF